MHVLVAAAEQTMPGDYAWTVEGELVHLPLADCDCPDCACSRAFVGVASLRSTSTVRVADLDISRDDYWQVIRDSLSAAGWAVPGDPECPPGMNLDSYIELHLEVAENWPEGTIIERVGDQLWARSHAG